MKTQNIYMYILYNKLFLNQYNDIYIYIFVKYIYIYTKI